MNPGLAMPGVKIRRTYHTATPIWVHWDGHKKQFSLKNLRADAIRAAVEKFTGEDLSDTGMLWRHDGSRIWHSIPATYDGLEEVRRQLIG